MNEELRARFDLIRAEVRKNLPRIATGLTLAAKAMAERNIKEEGFGQKYSTNQIPAWFMHGKELNKAGATYLAQRGVKEDGTQGEPKKRRKKKGEVNHEKDYGKTGTWGEFRGAQGLQNAHVDLSYSNKMWANMQPDEPEENGDVVIAALRATNTEAQEKMNWNRDRYGNFIGKALKPANFDTLGEYVNNQIIEILDGIKR